MTLVLIENAEVFAPRPLGKQSILIDSGRIIKVGAIDGQKLSQLDLPLEVINASGCLVTPGLIDPHQHILGAGGEQGFASRMPEITLEDEVQAGITTLVGLLGTDTSGKRVSSLYSKASQLSDEGLTIFIYTGGFELPPQTITSNLRDDIVFIDKVIGTGEVALSDPRWVDPELHQLAVIVAETRLGGMLSGKAGVTHFHLGPGKNRMNLLQDLLDQFEISPGCLYVTHINRTPELLTDAIPLARRGVYVDMDTTEEKLAEHLRSYLEQGGPPDQLTVSSDSFTPSGSPQRLFRQFVACVKRGDYPVETVLPFFTSNVARVLALKHKGELRAEMDADLLVLRKDSLDLVHHYALGRQFIREGQVVVKSKMKQQVEESH